MGVEHLLKFYTAQFNSRLRYGIEMSPKIDKNGGVVRGLGLDKVSTVFALIHRHNRSPLSWAADAPGSKSLTI